MSMHILTETDGNDLAFIATSAATELDAVINGADIGLDSTIALKDLIGSIAPIEGQLESKSLDPVGQNILRKAYHIYDEREMGGNYDVAVAIRNLVDSFNKIESDSGASLQQLRDFCIALAEEALASESIRDYDGQQRYRAIS